MARNSQCSSPQPSEWVKGKVIGSGSFGTVHLAMNKATGALFVVKSAQSEAGLQFLENEANILENSDSPYVVHCMGRDVLNGANGERKLNLFMEYMCGGSLADVAEKFGGALDEKVIRLYTREILQGLNYLHKNGIVHCDLKCKNVLLGSSGNIKLADFGCAKRLLNDLKTNGTSTQSCKCIGGTPLWMAPEVLRNEGLDFAADIWSLGCTIIEMATGRAPWGDEVSNPMAAVLKIACSNEIPEFPTQFSKEGLDFLTKCLERNLKSRWTTEELLNHPFVTGKSDDGNSRKEDVCSPASILDVGINEGSYESDESPDGSESISRIPFSMKCCGERRRLARRQWTDSELASSENWVTVRSG
uniref:Putative NPK1-related protein kinase 3 n=1 Tax=Davidia involucrata TaxID=16924 RepID=A0A5B7BEN4_DAVIN